MLTPIFLPDRQIPCQREKTPCEGDKKFPAPDRHQIRAVYRNALKARRELTFRQHRIGSQSKKFAPEFPATGNSGLPPGLGSALRPTFPAFIRSTTWPMWLRLLRRAKWDRRSRRGSANGAGKLSLPFPAAPPPVPRGRSGRLWRPAPTVIRFGEVLLSSF